MALADYYLCDACGGKCFYDANLNWEPLQSGAMELDHTAQMAALCVNCAPQYEIVIRRRSGAFEADGVLGPEWEVSDG